MKPRVYSEELIRFLLRKFNTLNLINVKKKIRLNLYKVKRFVFSLSQFIYRYLFLHDFPCRKIVTGQTILTCDALGFDLDPYRSCICTQGRDGDVPNF